MDILTNPPEEMSLDTLLAEIIEVSRKQGNQDIVVLIAKTDPTKVSEVVHERQKRLRALCDEISRRVELSSQG